MIRSYTRIGRLHATHASHSWTRKHFSSPIRQVSSDSTAPSSQQHENVTTTEPRVAQTPDATTFAAWRQSVCQKSSETATGTTKLVWLAKQSVATSLACGTGTSNTIQSASEHFNCGNHVDRTAVKLLRPTGAWVLPSAWAHLW